MHLLIQSRTDQSGWHELKCVLAASGLTYNQLQVINMGADFVTAEMLLNACKQADTIIIGGLGEVGYGEKGTKKSRWFNAMRAKFLPVLKEVIKNDDTKVLGICLGHQLLAEALNTRVAASDEQTELGVNKLLLTDDGKVDPLFKGIPANFQAIEGHRDAVLEQPKDTVLLASSQKCKIQAFRYKKYIYGVQFHPELTTEDYAFRVNNLYPKYSENSLKKRPVSTRLKTDKVIKNFIGLARL